MRARRQQSARRRAPEQTKQRLIEAAKRAFAERGFHGATVQEIAADAGVNISLVSHHFGGKAGIYTACLQGFGMDRLTKLETCLTPPSSIEEFRVRLELLVSELLEQHLAEPEVVSILLRDVAQRDLWSPELERVLFSFTTRFAEFFSEAQRRGLLREEVSPMIVAGLIYMAFTGMVLVSAHVERVSGMNLHDGTTRATLVRQILDVVYSGVVAQRRRATAPQ